METSTRVTDGAEVRRSELNDIIARRKAAHLLPRDRDFVETLRLYCHRGLLPPRAFAEFVSGLLQRGKLTFEDLQQLLPAWQNTSADRAVSLCRQPVLKLQNRFVVPHKYACLRNANAKRRPLTAVL